MWSGQQFFILETILVIVLESIINATGLSEVLSELAANLNSILMTCRGIFLFFLKFSCSI
jgi:hypothetical protein